jgi:hypothetical protein
MARQPFRKALAVGLVSIFAATACGGGNKTPAPTPTPTPATSWTVSGTVWVHQSGGVTRAQSGSVFGWVEHPNNAATTGPVRIGPDGRYDFTVTPDTIRVRVQRSEGYQPCAVTLESPNQLPADLHIVADTSQLGANIPAELAAKTPTLSGVVYESTPQGRRPVPNAWVVLDGLNGNGLLIADSLTDADGRYVLCAVPHLPRLVLQAVASGFELAEFTQGDVIGKTTVDIEMNRR